VGGVVAALLEIRSECRRSRKVVMDIISFGKSGREEHESSDSDSYTHHRKKSRIKMEGEHSV